VVSCGDVPLSWHTEEGTGRTWFCNRARATSDFRGSSKVTICWCCVQRDFKMVSCRSYRYVSSITTHMTRRYLMSSSFSLVGVPHTVTRDDIYEGFFIPKGGSCFLKTSCSPIYVFPGAVVIGNIWWVTLSILIEKLELLSGQFYMTLPAILNQICSNQSDSWIQMEPCSTILSWRRYLGLENGSVLEGTLSMQRCSFQSRLCFRFSTSKERGRVAISFLITPLEAFSRGICLNDS